MQLEPFSLRLTSEWCETILSLLNERLLSFVSAVAEGLFFYIVFGKDSHKK